MDIAELQYLFNPRNVCVIGASKNLNKVGGQVLSNIITAEFQNEIFPINPKHETLFGVKVYKSIKNINKDLDLAVLTIPNAKVPTAIEECVEQNVKFAVIISAGFGEMADYNPMGLSLKREIIHILKKGNMRVVGPNCMGVVSAESHLVALMGFGLPPIRNEINASIISQSGTWGITTMRSSHIHGLGISKVVCSGNELDLKFEDYLEYFGLYDSETRIILGFIEGLRQSRRFVKVIKEIDKPIVFLKGGKTQSGKKTAKSHTGSIAGSHQLYRSVFKQFGIIEVNEMKELVDFGRAFALFLSYDPPKFPKGNRVGVYSGGGGACVLLADNCESEGLVLPQLDPTSIDKLNQILPAYWSHSNPIDIVASRDFGSYTKVLKILLDDPNIDAVIGRPPIGFSLMFENEDIVEFAKQHPNSTVAMPLDMIRGFDMSVIHDMGRIAQKSPKPVIIPFGYYSAENPKEYNVVRELYSRGVMVTTSAQAAARIIKELSEYQKFRQRKRMKK